MREALEEAIRRGPPSRFEVAATSDAPGTLRLVIRDDAPTERRRRALEVLGERARTLGATLAVDHEIDGTTMSLELRGQPPTTTRLRAMDGDDGQQHLLFVWKPSGYELVEQDGDAPSVGAEVEVEGQQLRVTKLAPSPLPGDRRVCAYLAG